MPVYNDDRRQFWEDNIKNWNKNLYGETWSLANLIERVTLNPPTSKHFRHHVALEHITPHIQGKSVIGLGCGAGRLSKIIIERGATSYLGIDFSQNAIDIARQETKEAGLSKQITFLRSDIKSIGSLDVDFIVSVGLLHWLTWEEIEHVFTVSKEISFFHTVTQLEHSFRQFLRQLYIKMSKSNDIFSNYRKLDDILAISKRHGWENLFSFLHKDLYSIACLRSLPFPAKLGPQYVHTLGVVEPDRDGVTKFVKTLRP